jgi:O-antigen/teichoic acid export membrane protein
MVGTILPASSVAIFNAANRVNNLINIPVASAAAIVFPQSARNSTKHGEESPKLLYEKSVGILLALFLPALSTIFIFAEVIIIIIAGTEYIEAVSILKVIVITSLFYPFVRQFGTIMDSIGKPKINFYLLLIVSLMNIASNYIFITIYGAIGAALGTLLTMSIFTLLTQIILKRTIGVRFNSILVYVITSYKELTFFSLRTIKSLKLRVAE